MLFSSAAKRFIKKQDFLNANFDFGTSPSLTQFVVLDFDIKYSNCESLLVTARARYRTKKRIEI